MVGLMSEIIKKGALWHDKSDTVAGGLFTTLSCYIVIFYLYNILINNQQRPMNFVHVQSNEIN